MRLPTFKKVDTLLVGQAAIETWRLQVVRCGCGSFGSEDSSISGSCTNMPAKWLGCPNCRGMALGFPLVYRMKSQMAT